MVYAAQHKYLNIVLDLVVSLTSIDDHEVYLFVLKGLVSGHVSLGRIQLFRICMHRIFLKVLGGFII